jgi:hypothetical protein
VYVGASWKGGDEADCVIVDLERRQRELKALDFSRAGREVWRIYWQAFERFVSEGGEKETEGRKKELQRTLVICFECDASSFANFAQEINQQFPNDSVRLTIDLRRATTKVTGMSDMG